VQGPASPAGLIGYWPFDGNANAVIGVNGIMVSNPVPTMDRNMVAGGALAFDGTLQQRVEVPGGGGLNGLLRGTIAMWVKWSGPQDTGAANSAGAVLGRQQDGSFSDDIICLSNPDPTIAALQWRQNSATVSAAGLNGVGNNAWRHVAVTFTETNSQIFLDGNLEATGTGGLLHNNPATVLAIGAWIGGGGAFATAAIDDVAIWNRVLGAGELQTLGDPFSPTTPMTLLYQPDCITIARSGANTTLRWGSVGVLQSADLITGPWTDVPSAASPFVVTPSATKKFYRLRSP
jgi:hypothetical protein